MKYSFAGRIRYSELGEDRKLTMASLINYFQDCSNFQSEELGLGIDWLKSRSRAWVLVAWQIHIKRCPAMGEDVIISTWANGFKGFQGTRNFTMESGGGEMLACANSVWMYVNLDTGHPDRVPAEEIERYGIEEPLQESFGSRKIEIPREGGSAHSPVTVMEYHLDTNHHVNNGQYIQIAQGCIPPETELGELRAEYRLQARLGDQIFPVSYRTKKGWVVALNNLEGKLFAAVEFGRA